MRGWPTVFFWKIYDLTLITENTQLLQYDFGRRKLKESSFHLSSAKQVIPGITSLQK